MSKASMNQTAQQEGFCERHFRLKENNTNVRTEVIAGITTFMTMAYILFVNQALFRKLECPLML